VLYGAWSYGRSNTENTLIGGLERDKKTELGRLAEHTATAKPTIFLQRRPPNI
jgi:hypothetical protein